MEWRRTTEILLGGSTILPPSETNPAKTGILKYKNWQKRPDGVQTLHSIEAAKTLGNKIFSLSVAYMQELELEVPKFLPNVREDVTPWTQQGRIHIAQMGQIIRNLVYRLNPGSLPSCHFKRLLVMAQCLGDPAWLNSPLGMQIPTPIHWRLLEDNIT